MLINVLSVEVNNATSKAGKPYEQAVVAYRNYSDGKVASKTIMPFGFQKDTFVTLKGAKSGDVFNVEVQKNDAGYNDWIKATKAAAPANAAQSTTTTTSGGTAGTATASRGFETPQERAQKQVYIVRQSSLSNAVATLTVGRKGEVKPEEVIELAKRYTDFVLGIEETAKLDDGTIETLSEDIPF